MSDEVAIKPPAQAYLKARDPSGIPPKDICATEDELCEATRECEVKEYKTTWKGVERALEYKWTYCGILPGKEEDAGRGLTGKDLGDREAWETYVEQLPIEKLAWACEVFDLSHSIDVTPPL